MRGSTILIYFFSVKKGQIKEHKVELVKEQYKLLDIRKYKFSHRLINNWKQLSTAC